MREVDPLHLVETIREGLLVLDPDLSGPICEPFFWRR
jgi:hypothetical protein